MGLLTRALLYRAVNPSQSLRSRTIFSVLRSFSTSAVVHKSGSVSEIIASATGAHPLKDAAKFYGQSADRTKIWTYRDLAEHVNALANGFGELGYSSGDKILVWMPTGVPEYAATILAAAKTGVSIVTCKPPKDPANVDVTPVVQALHEYKPSAFIFWHDYKVLGEHPDEGIVATMHSVLNAIAPGVAVEDAKGLAGFSPLSGRPFHSTTYPFLKHVVHTGHSHIRGAVTFKSLLVYRSPPLQASSDASQAKILISAENGEGLSTTEILSSAESLGSKLQLNGDHNAKHGKLVIPPSTEPSHVAGIIAAVMHESLWISPGLNVDGARIAEVSSIENALVLQ